MGLVTVNVAACVGGGEVSGKLKGLPPGRVDDALSRLGLAACLVVV